MQVLVHYGVSTGQRRRAGTAPRCSGCRVVSTPGQNLGRAGSGAVSASSRCSQAKAWLRLLPHISADGRSDAHTAGRSGWPNSLQRHCRSSCTQATPAGLPWGMPGMAVLMEGAMQQAAQVGRHGAEPGDAGLAAGKGMAGTEANVGRQR